MGDAVFIGTWSKKKVNSKGLKKIPWCLFSFSGGGGGRVWVRLSLNGMAGNHTSQLRKEKGERGGKGGIFTIFSS